MGPSPAQLFLGSALSLCHEVPSMPVLSVHRWPSYCRRLVLDPFPNPTESPCLLVRSTT